MTTVENGAADRTVAAVLRSALEGIDRAVVVTGAGDPLGDAAVVYANPAFERLSKRPADRLLGTAASGLRSPDADPAALDRARHAVRAGVSYRAALPLARRDDGPLMVDWSLSPLPPEASGGAPGFWIAILEPSGGPPDPLGPDDALTRQALAALSTGVFEWWPDTDRLAGDAAFARTLGLAGDLPAPLSAWTATMSDEDAEGLRALLARALDPRADPNAGAPVECRCVRGDGRRVVVVVTAVGGTDSGGAWRVAGAIRTITRRHEIHARMNAAEEIAGLGNYTVDLQAETIAWSRNLFAIFGLDPATFEPDIVNSLQPYHPADRAGIEACVMAALESENAFEFDARVVRPGGEVRHVRAQGEIRRAPDGAPYEIFGVLQDRTDLVLKERQLERAQRLQAFGQLAGGVAHDFNNLLAVVMGNAELLGDIAGDRLGADDRAMLEEIVAAALRGRTLTDSLLSFARAAPLRPRALRVEDLAREIEEVLGRTLPATIDLRFDTAPDVWPLYVDRGNLQGALYNLALNARDAMPSGGSLRFEARNLRLEAPASGLDPGPYVQITATDTGSGIPAELQSRVFEPFFTTKPVGKGSGLGLSRVQGFAEQSGGAARLTSTPGAGTTVTLLLPAHGVGATALDAPDDSLAPEIAPLGTRVLLAEDIADVRRVMRQLLEREGFAVTEAASGDAALERVRAGLDPDLLVTDVVMPGSLQGPDLAGALRKTKPDLPVIYVSGYSGEAARAANAEAEPLRRGIRLMKPVSLQELRRALRRALAEQTGPAA